MPKLRIVQDTKIVDIDTLRKVLEDNSGMCHRYKVANVSKHRVKVGYSNPDEYAVDNWTYAILPCYTWRAFGRVTTVVVLEIIGMVNDPDDVLWQCFDFLKEIVT